MAPLPTAPFCPLLASLSNWDLFSSAQPYQISHSGGLQASLKDAHPNWVPRPFSELGQGFSGFWWGVFQELWGNSAPAHFSDPIPEPRSLEAWRQALRCGREDPILRSGAGVPLGLAPARFPGAAWARTKKTASGLWLFGAEGRGGNLFSCGGTLLAQSSGMASLRRDHEFRGLGGCARVRRHF